MANFSSNNPAPADDCSGNSNVKHDRKYFLDGLLPPYSQANN
ncbi:MAG: hypothetical protein P4L74_06810 [Candidatus Doudnabacteria bacterium]|nr:hypothetical protein [Candidatus Doudnabacteria bacterium]